jgi:glycosyltransferase involved in cell wall biosynthesis
MSHKIKRIGFISTRIAGADGVSLELEKWAEVLRQNKYQCFYFAGELDRPSEVSFLVEEAHFKHPDIKKINRHCFGQRTRSTGTSNLIHKISNQLKQKIYQFSQEYNIDLIIPQNALTIPMNIPLGLAISEFIAETNFPTIAHHHDFSWERDRFLINSVGDHLQKAFPPNLPSIRHVVINTPASQDLSFRRGVSNTVIPNVFDFDSPQSALDKKSESLRTYVGLGKEDPFILQPTRVVPRKWIERSIEIVHLMNLDKPKLIISHASGDEGDEYFESIKEYSNLLKVEIVSIDKMIEHDKSATSIISKLGEAYKVADFVTYPSGYEGFGNAFLETIYFRKPIVVNRYKIFIADIEPRGFDVVSFDGVVTRKTIAEIEEILMNSDKREQMVEKNYQIAQKYFSFRVVEEKLLQLIKTFE